MINSDIVSEKYRKYIIRLQLSRTKNVYLLWGTDKGNEDFDYLALNEENKILAFKRISMLVGYFRNNKTRTDPDNTRNWAQHYQRNISYTTHDLFRLKNELLVTGFSLKKLNRNNAFDLLDFFNLFSDYAYQTQDRICLKMIKEKNARIFFDYVYGFFFWDKAGREQRIERKIRNFNAFAFLKNYLKLISLFEQRLFLSRNTG